MAKPLPRLQSIDVFRALTMLLMIFVNDLDPIPGVPEWIKHVGPDTDGLGFADIIFPAFLFIVGLSIPFALRNRMMRGDTTLQVARYISVRAFALLVMGFFQVNLESYNTGSALLPKAVWEICITIAFFAIWLDYPRDMRPRKRLLLQSGGIGLLIIMSILYKGGTNQDSEWLKPQWWGILGLIGWSYLLCAFVFLVSKGRLSVQLAAMAIFLVFNTAAHAHWLSALSGIHRYIWLSGNGAMAALTMGGVLIAGLYLEANGRGRAPALQRLLILLGAVAIGLGFGLRFLDGISKIHATPSWVLICMGISIWVFDGIIYIVDVRAKQNWFRMIKPAGTSTLTCYLVPYLLYSIYALCHFRFPLLLNEGTGGLIKSMVTALVVVWITGRLEKSRLRLKV
jgi:heparan-alpha-glucosaminide N-acetyltransferase